MDLEFLEFLETIRVLELEKALDFIKKEKPDSSTLLEIGAGSGWQSKKLSENGFSVEAIDLESSEYADHRVWQVKDYDGRHIPYPDEYFDVVFSSNVLEHIPRITDFQKEIQRVLKPDGIALHILPSGSWRFWSNFTYYPFGVGLAFKIIFSKIFPEKRAEDLPVAAKTVESSAKPPVGLKRMLRGLIPQRHGEAGNTLSEIYYFSKSRWVKLFRNTGWKIKKYSTNNLFYTGYSMFGSAISTKARESLSRLAGSSCHIFLLTKNEDRD
jgi:SAM-dependent methyltransferase